MNSGLAFPVDDPRSASEKSARYVRRLDDRLPEREYHYALTMPRDWVPAQLPTYAPSDELPIALLGQFRPPTGGPAMVEVSARLLTREIAPADWLIEYLADHGHRLVHSRRISTAGGDVMDALTVGPAPDGAPAVSRWIALKDSLRGGRGRIVMSEARAPRESYPSVALDMMWTTGSLELVHPSGWPYAEKLRSFSAGRPGDFLIMYPYSWSLNEARADDTLTGVLVVELDNVIHDAPAGRITVMCSGSATQPRELVEPYLRALASRGLIPRGSELVQSPPFAGLARAWAASGSLHERKDAKGEALPPQTWPFDSHNDPFTATAPSYDLHLRVGQREKAWYLVAMVGVARTKSHVLSAINERGLAIVLDSMRTERAG